MSKPPTRVSASMSDRAFLPREKRAKFRITLDGVEQKLVITADSEEGYLKRNKTDANGFLIRAGEYFATEELHGKVEISVR